MLLKATDIIGKKVLSVLEGKEFAEVDDIVYDPQENKVKALLIDPGGWFSDAKVVLFEDVQSMGKDDILVESEKVVKKASDVSKKISGITNDNKHLTHTKIITEDGTKLGRVTDILFDPKTGKVEEFEVSKGGLLDFASGKKRVHVSDIITVGTDATIVKGYAKLEVEKQKGGVVGALDTAAQRSQTVFNEIRSEVSSTTQRMQRQAKKSDYGRKYIQGTQKQGQKVARDARSETENMIEDLRQRFQEVKNNPETQNIIDRIQTEILELEEMMRSGTKKASKTILEQRKKDALGKYLTKNILLRNDKILAKKGSLITNKLLKQAEKSKVLDQVLGNYSEKRG